MYHEYVKLNNRKSIGKVVKSFSRERIRVTVCIAAIYNYNAILGASDRMVTGGYGDITFEPPISKIFQLTNSIAVMTAGDQNIQTQVLQKTSKIIIEKINANPTQWLDISDVAEIYSKCFYDLRNKLIENNVLSKYNLTFDSFIAEQKKMSEKFIDMITANIKRYENDFSRSQGIETIITGVDNNGPHIYIVINGEVSCNDKLGFASIGIGSSHAISHFMLSKYSGSASESKALLTIHQAKKKSEVSPGVGKETDMCVIGPLKGSFTRIEPPTFTKPVVADLDNLYKKYKKTIEKLDKKTEDEIKDYLDKLNSGVQPKQEASVSASVSPSASPPPASASSSKSSSKSKKKK